MCVYVCMFGEIGVGGSSSQSSIDNYVYQSFGDWTVNAGFVACTCRHPFSMLASMSGIHAVGTRVLMASVSK